MNEGNLSIDSNSFSSYGMLNVLLHNTLSEPSSKGEKNKIIVGSEKESKLNKNK